MSPFAAVLLLIGAALALLAGIGMLSFSTPYARYHAAGKATPVAFLAVAIGAASEVGWSGAASLAVAATALVLTLPVGVHLLFRATHRVTSNDHLCEDALAPAERRPDSGQDL
ncbi:MAG: monovalent cation/H(+) antiporter subunit G [Acidimicrobiales bacterium]